MAGRRVVRISVVSDLPFHLRRGSSWCRGSGFRTHRWPKLCFDLNAASTRRATPPDFVDLCCDILPRLPPYSDPVDLLAGFLPVTVKPDHSQVSSSPKRSPWCFSRSNAGNREFPATCPLQGRDVQRLCDPFDHCCFRVKADLFASARRKEEHPTIRHHQFPDHRRTKAEKTVSSTE